MGLFDNYNKLEKQLLGHYTQFFTTMGLPDAKKEAKALLNDAIKKSKEERTYNLPPNFGDIILGKNTTEDSIVNELAKAHRGFLPEKRKEGVKDEDIKWWWNLNDVERWTMILFDNINRANSYLSDIQRGMFEDEAIQKVWRFYPSYNWDNPDEKPPKTPLFIQKREDYPLPIELKDRVNIWIQKRAEENSEKIKKEIESCSTLNALIRKEIKAGKT